MPGKRTAARTTGIAMPRENCSGYTVPPETGQLAWESLVAGGAFITPKDGVPFEFAGGAAATLKVDAERADHHPQALASLAGLLAAHPCVEGADVLSFVPNGMAAKARVVGELAGKEVVELYRPQGAPRSDIRPRNERSMELAGSAGRICLLEDVSSTGFSAHAAAAILYRLNPRLSIHSLSILQRGPVQHTYTQPPNPVTYHTLLRRGLPLTIQAFRQQFPDVPVAAV